MAEAPETVEKLPSDGEIILNSIKELSKQIVALQGQIREMRQEISYINSNNMRRHQPLHPPLVSQNPFYHLNEPSQRFTGNHNNYNNEYYNNILGAGRHY